MILLEQGRQPFISSKPNFLEMFAMPNCVSKTELLNLKFSVLNQSANKRTKVEQKT